MFLLDRSQSLFYFVAHSQAGFYGIFEAYELFMKNIKNKTTVNWAQPSNEYKGYVDTDMLPG